MSIDHLAQLNDATSGGWTESEGTMLISRANDGGIIDYAPAVEKWFVIFQDGRSAIEDPPSRDAAVHVFLTTPPVPPVADSAEPKEYFARETSKVTGTKVITITDAYDRIIAEFRPEAGHLFQAALEAVRKEGATLFMKTDGGGYYLVGTLDQLVEAEGGQ